MSDRPPVVPVARHVRLELGRRYLLEHYGKSNRIHYKSKREGRLEEVRSLNLGQNTRMES